MSQKVFLVGLPGAGKTTIGMEAALEMHVPFVDLDQEIEKETRQTIRMIFQQEGEASFRQLEYEQLRKTINNSADFVLATGGGTPCFFDNMDLMNSVGTTIFINTPIEQIKKRLQHDSVRPLMQTNTLESLYEKRKFWYNKANHTIQTQQELLEIIRSRN